MAAAKAQSAADAADAAASEGSTSTPSKKGEFLGFDSTSAALITILSEGPIESICSST